MFAFRSLLSLPALSVYPLTSSVSWTWLGLGASAFPALNLVTQRWKSGHHRVRKPIGSPRSRKKRYYVRIPTPRIPEEMSELYWRYSHYRTERRSLMNYFSTWKIEHCPLEAAEKTSVVKAGVSQELDEEFKKALQENEEMNMLVAEAREARRAEELKYRENERLDIYEEYDEDFEEKNQVREEQVRRKKEIVARLVTPENLEERINYALDNETDYNFAIDLRGRHFHGRPDPLKKINMPYPEKQEGIDEVTPRPPPPKQEMRKHI